MWKSLDPGLKGKEEVVYTEDGQTTDFVVDYGDGSCDNLYTVTCNGETKEHNFEHECYGEDGSWDVDSTGISG